MDESSPDPLFSDRGHAGGALGRHLREEYGDSTDLLIVGVPDGGIPVARQVARILDAPLKVLVVEKLPVPSQPELAFGAVASGGGRYLDEEAVRRWGLPDEAVEAVTSRERGDLRRREEEFGPASALPVEGRTVIVVDDVAVNGSTLRAALRTVRDTGATTVVAAVPVAAPDSVDTLAPEASGPVCLHEANPFVSVGAHYDDRFSGSGLHRMRPQTPAARGIKSGRE